MESRVKTDIIESEFGVQDMVIVLFSDSSIVEGNDLRANKEYRQGYFQDSWRISSYIPLYYKDHKG